MWTYEDHENLLANITLRRKFRDGEHRMTQLLAHEGYALHDKNDVGFTDEETGEYYPPIYSYQYTTAASEEQYLFDNFEAVLITPEMDVVGKPDTPEIVVI